MFFSALNIFALKFILQNQLSFSKLRIFQHLFSKLTKSTDKMNFMMCYQLIWNHCLVIQGGTAIRGGQRFTNFYCTSFKTNIYVDTE